MAQYIYTYDCPNCGEAEALSVTVHFKHHRLSASPPSWSCACPPSKEENEVVMDCALEEAEEDLWEWLDDDGADQRYERWVEGNE